MELTLDTYHIPKRIKTGYYFDDTVKATARFRRSGSLASVEIAGKVYNSLHEHFSYFKNMVIEAKNKLDTDNKLDEDCLVAISALGVKS